MSDKDIEKAEAVKKVRHWILEIEQGEKAQRSFVEQGKKLNEEFTLKEKNNSKSDNASDRGFHIFWSNIKTLQPALYSRRPKPEVLRRFKDRDEVARAASQILERATEFVIDSYDFDSLMKQIRDDYLIVGRGTSWVRYEPYFEEEKFQVTEQVTETGQLEYLNEHGESVDSESIVKSEDGIVYSKQETITYEEVICDYVNYKDFVHSAARTWEEVRWVARSVYLSRQELIDRFGEEIGNKVKRTEIEFSLKDDEDIDDSAKDEFRKAKVYEIWDKSTRKVYWVTKGYTEGVLDEMEDPLELTNFFPCPKPLLGTVSNDSLIPVADYLFYQDQAAELDEVSQRITLLTRSLKLSGIYDSEFDDLANLVDGSAENTLIPVSNYTALQQKGGLKGVVEFMPIQDVINTLQNLYQIRDRLKAEIYEITGISDLIRGHSNAAETATAQQIKGQFATMRLADRQAEIQRFAKDLIAIKAEIIAEHFEAETVKLIAGAEQIAETDEGLAVNVDEAIELLRNDVLRTFRIDIETDSTVAIDRQLEREQKQEFMNTFGNALQSTLEIGRNMPQLMPVMAEALAFMVRGVKAGRGLESSIEKAFREILEAQRMAAQQPPMPSPEQIKQQQDSQAKQFELQLKQQEQGFNQQLDVQKQQFEQSKVVSQQQLEQFKAEQNLLLQRTKLDMETALKAEKIRADQAEALLKMSNDPVMRDKPVSEQPINIVMPSGNKTTVLRTLPDGTKVAETVEAN